MLLISYTVKIIQRQKIKNDEEIRVKKSVLPWVHQFRMFLEDPWVPGVPEGQILLSHQGNHVHPKRGAGECQN